MSEEALHNQEDVRVYLRDVSEGELQRELKRREAVELKVEYDKRLAIGKFVEQHRLVLLELAQLLGNQRLVERLSKENEFWGQPTRIDFSLYDDDELYERCSTHGGGFVWDSFPELNERA